MPYHHLALEADVQDAQHWFWRLKDTRGNLLSHHEVKLDLSDWRARAFVDLYRYMRQHAAPDRQEEDEARLVQEVGEWAGERVLGPAGPAILAQGTPVTVQVVLSANQPAAESLQYLPLELAHVYGQPLALRDVSLVFEVRNGVPPLTPQPVGKTMRMLAVFSLPTGASALNLRQERYQLKQKIRSIARRKGLAIHLRVLQYGVTRKALEEILSEGEGWDLVHFSGHGLPAGLVLEKVGSSGGSVQALKKVDMLAQSSVASITPFRLETQHVHQLVVPCVRDSGILLRSDCL